MNQLSIVMRILLLKQFLCTYLQMHNTKIIFVYYVLQLTTAIETFWRQLMEIRGVVY